MCQLWKLQEKHSAVNQTDNQYGMENLIQFKTKWFHVDFFPEFMNHDVIYENQQQNQRSNEFIDGWVSWWFDQNLKIFLFCMMAFWGIRYDFPFQPFN